MSARQDICSLFQPLLLFAGFCKYLVIHSVMLQLSLTAYVTALLEYHLHLHLADAFIQSNLHCIQVTVLHFISSCFPWESNP